MIFFRETTTRSIIVMDCTICFCSIEGSAFACSDPTCLVRICEICITRYIQVVASENRKLACARPECSGEYDELSLKELDIDKKVIYRRALITYYKTEHTNDFTQIAAQKVAIEKLREERMQFYTTNMPPAVLKVATIVTSFKLKLKKVQKSETKTEASKYTRVCFNLFCGGFLNEEFSCMRCAVQFCKDCENEKKKDHKCSEEAKNSVAYINSLTACPNCKTKIEKGEGCMAITCAVCNTNFWYTTGKKGEAGNHGQSKHVTLKTQEKLCDAFSHILPEDLMKKLERFESTNPHTSEKPLITKAMTLQLSDFSGIREFSNMYSEFLRTRMNQKVFGKKLLEIENSLRKGDVKSVALLLQTPRYVISKIVERYEGMVFVEEIKSWDSIVDLCMHAKTDIDTVCKALSVNGILGDYLVEKTLQ
jgi:hypothetical protein